MLDKIVLLPYYLTLKIRNSLYGSGRKKSYPAEVPTVSVGNITVGGTGKTPHVEMILRMLLESDSWGAKNLAVLSRGYKRGTKGFQTVRMDGRASSFGDEPLQIKKKFPIVNVAVDKDRIEGCKRLVHDENSPADIIVLDDAFQYRKLKADKNILLVDYSRPIAKDKLLPFGHLRDLPERISDAEVIIVTKCPYELDDWEKASYARSLGIMDYQVSTCEGRTRKGTVHKIFFSGMRHTTSQGVFPSSDPRYIYSKKLIIVSGIAKDNLFCSYLSDTYKIVKRFKFPDHHKYTKSDIRKIMKAAREFPTAAIATTEKDAQRLLDYVGAPADLMAKLFYVPVEVDFFSDKERAMFKEYLTGERPVRI